MPLSRRSLAPEKGKLLQEHLGAQRQYLGKCASTVNGAVLPRATALLHEALERKQSLTDYRQIAITLEDLAALAVEEGRTERAARLPAAAGRLRTAIDNTRPVPECEAVERTERRLRAELDEERWEAAWAAGEAFALEDAIAEALEG